VIEGIDVGDTDDDGLNEVAAGAGETYVLQWNGSTYVEEAVLPTFGWMAVVCIGDCDNDGKMKSTQEMLRSNLGNSLLNGFLNTVGYVSPGFFHFLRNILIECRYIYRQSW